jgi:hypothetical protein
MNCSILLKASINMNVKNIIIVMETIEKQQIEKVSCGYEL